MRLVASAGFHFIEMPSFYKYNKKTPHAAMGCYVNYLELDKLILFPIFEVEGNKDAEALAVITDAFPSKQIVPVNINEIVIEGGLMNCITWVNE